RRRVFNIVTVYIILKLAEAKLNAIERTILNEISSPSKLDEDTSATSRQRTKTWVQDQQQNVAPDTNLTNVTSRRKLSVRFDDQPRQTDPIATDPEIAIGTQKSPSVPTIHNIPSSTPTIHNIPSSTPIIHNPVQPYPPYTTVEHDPATVVNKCLGAVAATSDKLTASLARISLPKCHPDIFFGDATTLHPWKSSFKGMISDSEITTEQEMNYLHMYTRGAPQKLVNSFRKRQYGDSNKLLKELWVELENRFGNVAIITNTLLTRLKEATKFTDRDKKSLQAFSDLCIDVSSQIKQLPGLA
ncbi:Hypothetical predicted protein, partial [Paramuricea clavata]